MLRKVFLFFSRPFARLSTPFTKRLLHTVTLSDPWQRFRFKVPLPLYGAGSVHDFDWYLEGQCLETFDSLTELTSWLCRCTYARDPDLFHEPDFWQHPVTFEQLRTGDCEDFALWTWRKLLEMGYEAEFVAGRCLDDTGKLRGHAWVLFRTQQDCFLFDPVVPDPARMIVPLASVKQVYLPEVSVDGRLRQYAYAGFYLLRRTGPETQDPATVYLPGNEPVAAPARGR